MGFTKAVKKQAKVRLCISGPSGAGKTMTALKLATAMGQRLKGRVALIDTEHKSSEKYADLFDFDVSHLTSYHPKNYIQAIRDAVAGGYSVLILDSLSHEWIGVDGALELVDRAAESSKSHNKFTAWGQVTPLHNQMIEAILATPLHVIATVRSKQAYEQVKNDRGETVINKIGLQPQQRDGLEYEFDVYATLSMAHLLCIDKSRCSAIDGQSYRERETELANTLLDWANDGAPVAETPVQSIPVDQETGEILAQPEPVTLPSKTLTCTNPDCGKVIDDPVHTLKGDMPATEFARRTRGLCPQCYSQSAKKTNGHQ